MLLSVVSASIPTKAVRMAVAFSSATVAVATEIWYQSGKLLPSDSSYSALFGIDISGLSSSMLVVGAPGAVSEMDNRAGAAYLFSRDNNGATWIQCDKVIGSGWDYFGQTVLGLSSRTFVVWGDDRPYDDAVFVFTSDDDGGSWVQTQKLDPPSSWDDLFGFAISDLNSSIFAVGAPHQNNDDIWPPYGQGLSGSVHVFVQNYSGSWVQSDKVVASDGTRMDRFGWAVSGLSGRTLVVGASHADDSSWSDLYAGAAYVFRSDEDGNWVQIAKITASDGTNFGMALSSLSDSSFVVGKWGSAHVITSNKDSWVQSAKLVQSDGYSSYFGYAVSGLNSSALAVASNDYHGSGYVCSAYVFRSDKDGNWLQSAKVVASDGVYYHEFGCAISWVGGSAFALGSLYEDVMAPESSPWDVVSEAGSVYMFTSFIGQCYSDSDCSNPEPVCSAYACEACTTDSDCTFGTCLGSGACGKCDSDSDCSNPEPMCSAYACEACTAEASADSFCTSGRCLGSGACGECDSDSDCSNPKPVCSNSSYVCESSGTGTMDMHMLWAVGGTMGGLLLLVTFGCSMFCLYRSAHNRSRSITEEVGLPVAQPVASVNGVPVGITGITGVYQPGAGGMFGEDHRGAAAREWQMASTAPQTPSHSLQAPGAAVGDSCEGMAGGCQVVGGQRVPVATPVAQLDSISLEEEVTSG